jgi:hypothetical protein
MAVELENAVDLDKRLDAVPRSYLVDVLEQIRGIVDDPTLVQRDTIALRDALAQVIDIVMAPDLLALTRDHLVDITRETPDDMIAVANPSVRLLNRGSLVEEDEGPRQVAQLLSNTASLTDYNLGQLAIDMNPYFKPSMDLLSETQFEDATDDARQGGPLRGFNAFHRWSAGNVIFGHIPHPDETYPGVADYQPPWYLVTGRTPKDIPVPVTSLPTEALLRARNVVKTVEVEYGTPIDTGDVLPGGAHKIKQAHIFLVYAGGNGT